jgi:hypothetical protein
MVKYEKGTEIYFHEYPLEIFLLHKDANRQGKNLQNNVSFFSPMDNPCGLEIIF